MPSLAVVSTLWLFLIVSCAKAFEVSTVSFLESTPGSYLRIAPSKNFQGGKFTHADVSAVTSVLLGSAPSSPINDESASKLNALLVPDPFHRPRAVLLLTLEQVKPGKFKCIPSEQRGSIGSLVAHHGEIQQEAMASVLVLPDDVTVLSLNATTKRLSEISNLESELKDLASFLGGSYESSKGVLMLQLVDGDMVTLDLEKEEHLVLINEVSAVIQRVKDATTTLDAMHGGLIVGSLTVSKDLYEAPDSSITSREASDLLHVVAVKVFSYLDSVLKGGLVGVIIHAPEQILDLKFSSRPSRLLLRQALSDTITATVAEVLTETIIAYITGILLIIALIIATCCLFKMPLTRDTLLYSGAKMD